MGTIACYIYTNKYRFDIISFYNYGVEHLFEYMYIFFSKNKSAIKLPGFLILVTIYMVDEPELLSSEQHKRVQTGTDPDKFRTELKVNSPRNNINNTLLMPLFTDNQNTIYKVSLLYTNK